MIMQLQGACLPSSGESQGGWNMAPIFRADRHQYVTNVVVSISSSLYKTCLSDESLLPHLRCHNKVLVKHVPADRGLYKDVMGVFSCTLSKFSKFNMCRWIPVETERQDYMNYMRWKHISCPRTSNTMVHSQKFLVPWHLFLIASVQTIF